MKNTFSLKKLLIIVSIFGVFGSETYGQNLNNKKRDYWFYQFESTARSNKIYGNPKVIEEYMYYASDHFGDLEKDLLSCFYIDSFGANGNLVKHSWHNSKEDTYTLYEYENNFRYEYFYRNNKYISKSIYKNNVVIFEISFEENKSDTTKYFYQNNKVKTILSPHKFFVKQIYSYDKSGNLLSIEYYTSDGKLHGKDINKYNLQNKIVESKYLSLNDYDKTDKFHLKKINTYTYHPNGELKEEVYIDIDNYKTIHQYPIQGNKHYYKLKAININKLNKQNIVTWDETRNETFLNGRVIKKITKNELTSNETITKYEYNSKGDLTREITYGHDGWIFDTRHEYIYDYLGNLVEIKNYSKDENGIFRKYLSTISEIKYTY
jgi:hypothetical protein